MRTTEQHCFTTNSVKENVTSRARDWEGRLFRGDLQDALALRHWPRSLPGVQIAMSVAAVGEVSEKFPSTSPGK
jgi:hypothetical protein